MKKKKTELQEVPRRLIEQSSREFTKYSVRVINSQLISMACNPVTATIGLPYLNILVLVLETKRLEEIHKPFQVDYKLKANAALVEKMKDICS